MKVERQLVLEVGRHEVSVGDSITVRVRDRSNRPVEGATVSVGSKQRRTDSRGHCELTVHAPGFRKLVARKGATDRVSYRPATELVRALPRSKLDAQRSNPRTL